MGETNQLEAVPKKSKFKSIKAEFKKIIWPDKQSLLRQTVSVVSVSIVLGIIIAAVDAIYTVGIDWLLG